MKDSTEIICLVDDDPAVLTSVRRLLSSDGYAVMPFDSPRKFLDYARNNSVRLAILDVWMKEMQGLEVQAELAKISPATRVIVMTGRKDGNVEPKAMHQGAVAFFTKPFDDERFLLAIRRALQSAPPNF